MSGGRIPAAADGDTAQTELQVMTGSCGSRSQVEALGEDVQKLLETLTKTPAMIKIKRSLDEMACLRTRLLAFRDALDATSGPNADDKHEPTPIERPTETKAELEEEEDATGLLALEAPVGFVVTVTSSNCCCDHCDQSNLWRIVAQHDSSSCSVLVSISQLQPFRIRRTPPCHKPSKCQLRCPRQLLRTSAIIHDMMWRLAFALVACVARVDRFAMARRPHQQVQAMTMQGSPRIGLRKSMQE